VTADQVAPDELIADATGEGAELEGINESPLLTGEDGFNRLAALPQAAGAVWSTASYRTTSTAYPHLRGGEVLSGPDCAEPAFADGDTTVILGPAPECGFGVAAGGRRALTQWVRSSLLATNPLCHESLVPQRLRRSSAVALALRCVAWRGVCAAAFWRRRWPSGLLVGLREASLIDASDRSYAVRAPSPVNEVRTVAPPGITCRRWRMLCATTISSIAGCHSRAQIVVRLCESGVMDEALTRAAAEVAALASRPVYGVSDAELADLAAAFHAIGSRCAAVVATVAHEASGRDLPRRQGATSAVAWLRDLLRITAAEARVLVSLGETLDARPMLADAVADGAANAGQILAIGRVLANVPDGEQALVDKVEAVLVGHAAQFEPTILRGLGDRVLAHLDPDLADRRLRDRLEREQRHAEHRRGFTLSPDGLGGIRLSGILDPEGAAIVDAAIGSLSGPAPSSDGPDLRTPAARRADALVDVCRLALRTGDLPASGGQPAQLTVTIDFQALQRDVAIGQLDTGGLLAPSIVRRLACDAHILPAVLDGASVPVDLGRTRRLYTGATRTAVLLRDRGCAFPGCDRPPRWTDIHHVVAWQHGGATDQDNGVALCRHHHRLIHTGDWTVQLGPHRHPQFIPPAYIDPTRAPQQNPYHPRR